MAGDKRGTRINRLLERTQYAKARDLIERELESDPTNHWLLTQLGVTLYEERRYKEALEAFETSRKILPTCPLTRWNLAGTLDALGKSARAVQVYTSLIKSTVSPEEDPCWESKHWADRLKTDCVYRIGVCFMHLGKRERAQWCFRQYVQLLMAGIEGSYSVEQVMRHIKSLRRDAPKSAKAASAAQKAVEDVLAAAVRPLRGRATALIQLDLPTQASGTAAPS